ncbi:MAG: hypothetical protein JWR85_755 [Marmoricola sp.]|nr:hypothetical protein [Marmoricola sp.]
MSFTSVDLARATHDARMVEAEEGRRASRAAAARRWQRKAVRLSHKAERVSRRAERAASQAQLAVARAL